MSARIFIIALCFYPLLVSGQAKIYKTNTAKISFVSEAPLEIIKATSKNLTGVVNLTTNNFSFKVLMKNFEGFNNPLQKEHFYENYMETDEYPESTFTGKIIEPVIMGKEQDVRAKGILTVHGKSTEVLVDLHLKADEGQLEFSSKFEVLLEDFNINVPRIVSQKIAKNIFVTTSGVLIGSK